jgi:hypothetical protein
MMVLSAKTCSNQTLCDGLLRQDRARLREALTNCAERAVKLGQVAPRAAPGISVMLDVAITQMMACWP